MSNECKGCIVYNEDDNRCAIEIIPHISETEHCPCINCIVKVMCKVVCQEFKLYAGLSTKRDGELRRKKEDQCLTNVKDVYLLDLIEA